MNLRNAVIQNLKNSSSEDIFETISDAISSSEEKTLPGLGVIFEVLWKSLNEDEKNNICQKLMRKLS